MTEVCSAPIPPPAKRTIAITPRDIAQITLKIIGGSSFVFSFFDAVNIEVTKAPESEEVTKKVRMMVIARPINNFENGNCSKKTNSETAISLLMAVLNEFGSINSWYKAALPKTPIHKNTIDEGTNTVPIRNSWIDLPYDILAINNPTNGDHANHQE